MNYSHKLEFLIIGTIFLSCESPFTPKSSKDEDLFQVWHDIPSGVRIIQNIPITLTWSELTIEEFSRIAIFRTIAFDGQEIWEERGEITNPLTITFLDTIDDDHTYRYKVRIVDVHDNYREAITEKLFFRTTSVFVPDEFEFLQQAFDSPFIDDGDSIFVQPGIHPGPFVLLDKDIFIIGMGSMEETILRTNASTITDTAGNIISDHVISFNRGHLTNFTVTGGGGINVYGTGRVNNCNITGITTFDQEIVVSEVDSSGNLIGSITYVFRRAGIVVSDSAVVTNCTITNNSKYNFDGSGGDGGGMIVQDHATVRHCLISNNSTSTTGGGISIYGAPTIMNCIIHGNNAGTGGGGLYLSYDAAPIIINCTIVGNNSEISNGKWGAARNDGNAFNILNSIIWGNSSSTLENRVWKDATYSDIQGYNTGTDNISAAPRFISYSSDNFHLSPDSPCINTGNPDDAYNDVDGSRNDMGAYGGPYGDW